MKGQSSFQHVCTELLRTCCVFSTAWDSPSSHGLVGACHWNVGEEGAPQGRWTQCYHKPMRRGTPEYTSPHVMLAATCGSRSPGPIPQVCPWWPTSSLAWGTVPELVGMRPLRAALAQPLVLPPDTTIGLNMGKVLELKAGRMTQGRWRGCFQLDGRGGSLSQVGAR